MSRRYTRVMMLVTLAFLAGGATLPATTPAAATYPTIDSLFALLKRTEKSAVKEVGFDDTYLPDLSSGDMDRISELARTNFGVDEPPMNYKGTMERATA